MCKFHIIPDLEIGPDIRINVTGYINLRREAPKSWKKCLTHDNGEVCEIKPVTTFVRNNEEQDTVELDNLMESFKYGSQQITVNGESFKLFQLLHFILHEFDNKLHCFSIVSKNILQLSEHYFFEKYLKKVKGDNTQSRKWKQT